MKALLQKDKKNRKIFSSFEKRRKILNYLIFTSSLPLSLRLKASTKLSTFPKSSALTRIKKRCLLTGRSRFLLGKFNLSRLSLRKLAGSGLIPGLKKSSW